jgi:acetoin utilization protein AcuB
MKQELVKDWMSKEVIVIQYDRSLPEAHQLMSTENIRRLPVTNDKGRLVGMITLSDVRSASPSPATSVSIFEMNYLLSSLAVERIMATNPVTIHPQQTIKEAAKLMLKNRISGLPVINDEDLICGIITESDIFRMIVLYEWDDKPNDNSVA